MSVIRHKCLVDRSGFLDQSLGRFEAGRPSDDIVHLGPEGYKRLVSNIKDCVISKRKNSVNIVPYKRSGPLSRPPVPRVTLPYPARTPWPYPPYPHPLGQLGFPPLPKPAAMPSTATRSCPSFPPAPRSFTGNYHRALIRPNYDLANPSIYGGCQY